MLLTVQPTGWLIHAVEYAVCALTCHVGFLILRIISDRVVDQ